jgi:hypothetical protein
VVRRQPPGDDGPRSARTRLFGSTSSATAIRPRSSWSRPWKRRSSPTPRSAGYGAR